MPAVLLVTPEEDRVISIGVGPFEASAIIVALEGLNPPRALTHDLLSVFFKTHGFKADMVHLYNYVDGKYFTKLHYRKGFRRYKVEVRPSDASALAVRMDTPIFVSEDVLNHGENLDYITRDINESASKIIFLDSNSFSDFIM